MWYLQQSLCGEMTPVSTDALPANSQLCERACLVTPEPDSCNHGLKVITCVEGTPPEEKRGIDALGKKHRAEL